MYHIMTRFKYSPIFVMICELYEGTQTRVIADGEFSEFFLVLFNIYLKAVDDSPQSGRSHSQENGISII